MYRLKKMIMNEIKAIFVKIRLHRYLSWKAVAEEIGISRMTLMKILDYSKKPSELTAARMADFVNKNKSVWKGDREMGFSLSVQREKGVVKKKKRRESLNKNIYQL